MMSGNERLLPPERGCWHVGSAVNNALFIITGRPGRVRGMQFGPASAAVTADCICVVMSWPTARILPEKKPGVPFAVGLTDTVIAWAETKVTVPSGIVTVEVDVFAPPQHPFVPNTLHPVIADVKVVFVQLTAEFPLVQVQSYARNPGTTLYGGSVTSITEPPL